jgi:heterodisulfide reductase subunit C
MGIGNIIFILVLVAGVGLFARNLNRIIGNIRLGKDVDLTDNKGQRWATMARVALGQSKMVKRPIAGILHIIVYIGFVLINIEVLEIVIDGIFGTHRIFAPVLGGAYDAIIGSFEILALLVLVACVVFFIRRNGIRIKRFWSKEMLGWPRSDANYILIAEILLMGALLKMNATDQLLAQRGVEGYIQAGAYPISSLLLPFFDGYGDSALVLMERTFWWFHIVGILIFLNYLPYSKHFHILLAFPNTYYSNLKEKGYFRNMPRVTDEVKLMMDPSADPFAASPPQEADSAPQRFGAKDVQDLTWKQLMDAYSCTECGRCTSECPANQTGKLLSPRKIMMDTRDRLEVVGKNVRANGNFKDDQKSLLFDHITEEELWACTSCNACTEACPVNIDPLSIIIDMRRYLVMEESKTRPELTAMFNNIENNGAPWPFAQADLMKWTEELNR